MKLKELLRVMTPSERMVIICDGKELYKGYVGCTQYYDLPLEKEVIGACLGTEIYRKEHFRERETDWKAMGTVKGSSVAPEQIDQYKYSDLIMNVFIRITVEAGGKQEGDSA